MNKPKSVLYFEDTDDTANEVIALLRPLLDGIATVERFVATNQTEEMYDKRLEEEIASRQNDQDIVFILSDADLATTASFTGLSDTNVHKVASKLGIPSAYYSSNMTGFAFLKAELAGDGRILLDKSDLDKMTIEVACLVKGFITISDSLDDLSAAAADSKPHDTASLLAVLLGRPELKSRVKLYISGDQRLGAEFLSAENRSAKRKATILGSAIYESLLKYPGLTLNSVAAASYTNIAEREFEDADVRAQFEFAKYEGPFASSERPLWWRDLIDEIIVEGSVGEQELEDGRDYIKAKLDREVSPCKCVQGNHDLAGYFCMITRRPVCEEHSVGGLSWFPSGADLSRISTDKYDELAPWLAI